MIVYKRQTGEKKNKKKNNQLVDTFGRKSTARHKIYQLLESSKSWLNWIRADDKNIVNCSNPVLNCCQPFFLNNYFTETAGIQSAQHFLQLKLSNILNLSRFMIYIDQSETTRHFFAQHNLKFLMLTGENSSSFCFCSYMYT